MTCATCTEARTSPEHYRLFADYCLYCAARRIQYIQRKLQINPSAKPERCRAALAQAVSLGLPDVEIRSMAKKPEWQLQQPAQDAQPESLPAPRKRGR